MSSHSVVVYSDWRVLLFYSCNGYRLITVRQMKVISLQSTVRSTTAPYKNKHSANDTYTSQERRWTVNSKWSTHLWNTGVNSRFFHSDNGIRSFSYHHFPDAMNRYLTALKNMKQLWSTEIFSQLTTSGFSQLRSISIANHGQQAESREVNCIRW
jgi:hypothetical protein